MNRRFGTYLAAFALTISLGVGAPIAAQAAVAPTAANGEKCTIKGTSKSDRITGTSKKDVICGLGGNDVIVGGGGNDIIDGGSGDDRLLGSSGNDKLYGGTGKDALTGGTGSDALAGGSGNDSMSGQEGNDALVGGTGDDRQWGGDGTDVVKGGTGNDVLDGGSGNDAVIGESGNDAIAGGSGNDKEWGGDGKDSLKGGSGNDLVNGDDGNDKLYGEDGDDELNGGEAADAVDGGEGTNWCEIDSDDIQKRCVYDKLSPEFVSAEFSQASVDVSTSPQSLEVTAHLTDDTGIMSVSAYVVTPDNHSYPAVVNWMQLVEGDVRDGTYRDVVTVPRWIPAATYHLALNVTDRVGHEKWINLPDIQLQVLNTNADILPATMSALGSPATTTTVDVRTAAASVTVEATLADAVSGVRDAQACLSGPVFLEGGDLFYGLGDVCTEMTRVSGTAAAGTYRAVVTIPRGAVGGDWNVSIATYDNADNYWAFAGPEQVALFGDNKPGASHGNKVSAIPNGKGRVTVIGTSDNNAPAIIDNSITPDSVDTLPREATVQISARATDLEGVKGVLAVLKAPQNGDGLPPCLRTELVLSSGSINDGTWTGSIELSQGMPPGNYYLELIVWDLTHSRRYESPESYAYGWTVNSPVPGDGWVTVIDSETKPQP